MELLSAQSVAAKDFKTVRLREGYDPVEVDGFLDQVIDTLKELYAQLDEFAQASRTDQTVVLPSMAAAQKLLDVAQRAADEVEAEANGRAAAVAVDAQQKADEVAAEARRQADVITGGAIARKEEIAAQLDKLVDHRDRARRAHEAALNVLKDAD